HDFPAKGYASHGESWSLALALRLASYDLLRLEEGDLGDGEPILILDDVFSELDTRRRERLGRIVTDASQVLITTANDSDIPEALEGEIHGVEATLGAAVRRGGRARPCPAGAGEPVRPEHLVAGGTDRGAGRGVGRAPVPGDGGAASPRTARRRISCRGRSPRGGARGRGGALRPAGAAGLRRPLRARPPHREPVPGGGP